MDFVISQATQAQQQMLANLKARLGTMPESMST
jgi:hypothetical protein